MELYVHHTDPNERSNLAEDSEHAEAILSLQTHLPKVNVGNAKGSAYSFNEYFKKALR